MNLHEPYYYMNDQFELATSLFTNSFVDKARMKVGNMSTDRDVLLERINKTKGVFNKNEE